MAARILEPSRAGSRTTRPARTSSPASPRRSSPPATPSSGCSRSTRRRCPRSRGGLRPRASALGQPVSRPARPLRRARARGRALARDGRRGLPAERAARGQRRRPAARRARHGTAGSRGLRRRRSAPRRGRRSSTRPTRSAACAAARRTRTPRPTSATSATTAARPAATRGRRSTSLAREIELHGLDERLVPARRRRRARARVELRLPGLYNVYNALAAAALARARSAPRSDEIVAGLRAASRAAFGRFERIAARRAVAAHAADQEPGRRERGRAHARRRRRAPRSLLVALNDEIADGRDVSWIWDVDFEPLLDGLERLDRDGRRARPSSRCASSTAGLPATRSRSCPTLEARARPRARADAGRAAS